PASAAVASSNRFLFEHASRSPRDLPSFPTRRSSDLPCSPIRPSTASTPSASTAWPMPSSISKQPARPQASVTPNGSRCCSNVKRSEEHTSELQSRFDLVCRLLLEKQKQSDRPSTSSA